MKKWNKFTLLLYIIITLGWKRDQLLHNDDWNYSKVRLTISSKNINILNCLSHIFIGQRLGFEGNLPILSQITLSLELQITERRLKR